MKGDKIILLWRPANDYEGRTPSTTLQYADETGKDTIYRHYQKNGRWEIEVDRPLASFLLSRMSSDYHLLSPNTLRITLPTNLGATKTKMIKSIEPKTKGK